MRAIGYPRVSSEKQSSDGFGLEAQITEIERFCAANNIELVAHYREVESAKDVVSRPIFKSALKRLHAPDVDAIICVHLDRFARNLLNAEALRQALHRRGKHIISTRQTFLNETHANDFERIAAVQHAYIEAERERHVIRTRLASGKQAKVSGGGWQGHRPSYQYDVVQGELVLNYKRHRAIVLIRRLDRWVENITARAIQQVLHQGGYASPSSASRERRRKRRISAYRFDASDLWPLNTINRIRRKLRNAEIASG